MDFAWVVDALRRGLKVTRKSWAGDPPMYLYLVKDKNTHQKHIMCYTGTSHDFEWFPPTDLMLDADDWEEYVEPRKAEPAKATQEELPVWPEVNADGYARMSEDSDVVIHDGVYRKPKKEPVPGDTPILQFIRETTGSNGLPGDTMPFASICKGCFNCLWRKKGQTDCGGHPNLIRNAAGIVTECSSWILRPDTTEDVPHDSQAAKGRIDYAKGVVHCGEDTGYMAEQLEMLADIYAEKISQRVAKLLQKTDVPLPKEDTSHV